jgi:hypothetical protein
MNTSLQLLDQLLKILENVTEKNAVDLEDIRSKYPIFQTNNLPDRNWETMRKKLYDEKMIDFIKKPSNSTIPNDDTFDAYFITFNGLLLLEYEYGYEGRHNTAQSEKEQIKDLQEKTYRNNYWIAFFAALTALATVGSCLTSFLTYKTQEHQENQKKICLDTLTCKYPHTRTVFHELKK